MNLKRIDREYRDLIRRALEFPGVTLLDKRRHTQVLLNGVAVTTVPVSGSDWRGIKACRCDLRRAGIMV